MVPCTVPKSQLPGVTTKNIHGLKRRQPSGPAYATEWHTYAQTPAREVAETASSSLWLSRYVASHLAGCMDERFWPYILCPLGSG